MKKRSCQVLLVTSVCLFFALRLYAQDEGRQIYLGAGGGFGVPDGPPSLRSGILGEMQAEIRATDRLWVSLGLGGLFSASDHNNDFKVIVFHARLSIQYDLPLDLSEHASLYVNGGPIYQNFDPVGRFDAQESVTGAGFHLGGGVWRHMFSRIRLQGFLRITSLSSNVGSFPLSTDTGGNAARSFHIYLGTVVSVRL